jgi:hypothetical protein
MNSPEKRYSPFWAILLFFIVAFIFDLDQTVKVHRQKLEVMQQYAQALRLRPQAETQIKWILAMRDDLLRLAPGHPEASKIVEELHMRPEQAAPDSGGAGHPEPAH